MQKNRDKRGNDVPMIGKVVLLGVTTDKSRCCLG